MKFIFLFFCLITSLDSYSKTSINLDSIGNVESLDISLKGKRMENSKTFIDYEVNVLQSGKYYLYFWVLGHKESSGLIVNYLVVVNDSDEYTLSPKDANWSISGLTNNSRVNLKKGKNIVSIVGNVPEIPQVELKFVTSLMVEPEKYDTNYITYLNDIKNKKVGVDSFKKTPLKISQNNNFPYDYEYVLNKTIYYTFSTDLYFSENEQVNVIANSTNGSPFEVRIFNLDDPESKSYYLSSNANGYLDDYVIVLGSGLYRVLVRTRNNETSALCNIAINDEFVYEGVPIYNYFIETLIDTSCVYDNFTCHSHSISDEGDPVIYLEDLDCVRYYNTDYDWHSAPSYPFDWVYNARIKRQFNRIVEKAFVFETSSYTVCSTTDIYLKCKEVQNQSIFNWFPNLYTEHTIHAAPADFSYNCFAWSVGIWDNWEDPLYYYDENLEHNGFYPDGTKLLMITEYYEDFGFQRVDDEEDAVVDIYGTIGVNLMDNGCDFAHASVAKFNQIPHGFAWESKLGSLERIFHTRYSVQGNDYGIPLIYFAPTSTQFSSNSLRSNTKIKSLYEKVADGEVVIETISFTDEEIKFKKDKVNSIPIGYMDLFNNTFKQWENKMKSTYMSIFDNKNDTIYLELLNICDECPNLLYVIMQKAEKNDVCAIQLMKHVALKNSMNSECLRLARNYHKQNPQTSTGQTIYRSTRDKALLFAKYIIHSELTPSLKYQYDYEVTGIRCSNTFDFTIHYKENSIVVESLLDNQESVSCHVYTLDGQIIPCDLKDNNSDNGFVQFVIKNLQSGTYLVCVKGDKCRNVKKIIIK